MKVVHMCLGCFFPDNYSYQENMLPKFHKQLGHEVEVIASLETFDKNGKSTHLDKGSIYQNEYDIKVTRLDYKKPVKVYQKLKRYIGTYSAIEKAQPDILFIHGCQFMDMDEVLKYVKKHPSIKVFVDNHADFSNSGTNFLSRNILHKVLWRHTAQMIEPYTTKFYGVLPARVEWLENMYKLPKSKCELLVMGADDEEVERAKEPENQRRVRNDLNIAENDFLIVTGGKIDEWKTQTLLLMQAISNIKNDNVKLLIFGPISEKIRGKFDALFDNNKMRYVSWANTKQSYDYFAAADLAVFPGRHSVYWEQVAGLGIPMLCKYWEGTTHVDLGGNVAFLKEDSVEEIKEKIENLVSSQEKLDAMKKAAMKQGMEIFSYKAIAIRAIGREKAKL